MQLRTKRIRQKGMWLLRYCSAFSCAKFEQNRERRGEKMKKKLLAIILIAVVAGFIGSGTIGVGATNAADRPIRIVWYPNESAVSFADSRAEWGRLVTQATGRPVEHMTTTDYVIAIEALANGQACLGGHIGAVGYIIARSRTPDLEPLFVNTGPSGTLDDALYFSYFAVRPENMDEYRDGNGFSITNIQGKRMAFVSTTSTSGFVVPTTAIIDHFSQMDRWQNLEIDDMLQGGPREFFSDVFFGGAHPGTAFALLNGMVDVAAFMNLGGQYGIGFWNLVEGENHQAGAVYEIIENAEPPFDAIPGRRFIIISSIPVLNAPAVVNTANLTAEELKSIRDLFTSDEVAENPLIFSPRGSDVQGIFAKTANQRYVLVDDAWYNPLRR